MKFLIFDTDRSLATIGGSADIRKATGGIPEMPITGGVMQVKDILDKLWTKKVVEEKHELLGITFKDTKVLPTPEGEKLGLDGIVIDTISQLFQQDKRILEEAKGGTLELQDWGKLERLYTSLMLYLVNLPIWVIINSHITYDKDQNMGLFYYKPQISGSTADNLPKYMDCVFFTRTSINQQKQRVFQWQTFPDNSKHAKDRKNVTENLMPQDFGLLLSKYAAVGVPTPKILIIGESGAGKTRALTTINK